MSKVLIIGASGLLGSALSEKFGQKFNVVSWDRPEIDVTNREETLKKITAEKPDFVINATAFNGVDQAEKDESSFRIAEEINGKAVGYIAEAGDALSAPVIHFSTDYVFPGDSTEGYDESASPAPLNKYGQTKLRGEELLRKFTDKYYLVRLSRLFGPPGKTTLSKKSFVDLIIDAAQKQPEVRVVDEENSCPTYSVDLSDLVFRLVQDQMPFGIYHGANTGVTTWYKMTQEIFKLKNIATPIIPITSAEYNRAAKRPDHSELINTKLPKQRSWEESVEDYLTGR